MKDGVRIPTKKPLPVPEEAFLVVIWLTSEQPTI
jgi:hypothetical protein